jgi:hypothetical protein
MSAPSTPEQQASLTASLERLVGEINDSLHSLAVGATSNEEELRQRIETVGRELYAVRIALLRTGILTLADLQAAEKELAAGIDIERPEGDASI